MHGFVGVTDFDWYTLLRARTPLDEVNFWQPSGGRGFHAIQPGEPFLFKLHAPRNVIGGFGLFARHAVLPDWLAWDTFGEANGASDLDSMRRRIEKYLRVERRSATAHYSVGCLMVAEPVFFAEHDWIEQPRDWKPNIVQGKTYDLAQGEGSRIWDACLERANRSRPELLVAEGGARFGTPVAVRPRLGQGTFRIAVTEAYDRACAVTTEHSLPVLEAAPEQEWHNGVAYYQLHGSPVRRPSRPEEHPDRELLVWHNEKVFLG